MGRSCWGCVVMGFVAACTPTAPLPPYASSVATSTPSAAAATQSARAVAGSPAASPAPRVPEVTIGTVGAMSYELPAAHVEPLRARLRDCYRRELERDPTIEGSTRLVGRIGPDGAVFEVTVPGREQSRLPGPLLDCLAAQLEAQRFPPPEGAAAVLVLPLAFHLRVAPAPAVGAGGAANEADLHLELSATHLLFGTERSPVLPLPTPETASRSGVDAAYKRSGPNDLYLVPLAERVEALRAAGALREPATARIEAQADLPYRVLIEVVYTLGQVGFGRWLLAESARPGGDPPVTVVAPQKAPLASALPGSEQPAPANGPASNELTVQLRADGYRLRSPTGTLASGCTAMASDAKAATIPLRSGSPDLAALRDCAARLKASRGEPGVVTFVAEPSSPYGLVMTSLAALRGDPRSAGYPLFATVQLGVPPSPPAASANPRCAEVQIGLDLRALPTNRSNKGVDLFVAAQTSQFEAKAPPGPALRFMHWPGLGLFQASLDGPNWKAALARCEAAVTRYLASGPRLPVIRQPAARVISPCSPCSP